MVRAALVGTRRPAPPAADRRNRGVARRAEFAPLHATGHRRLVLDRRFFPGDSWTLGVGDGDHRRAASPRHVMGRGRTRRHAGAASGVNNAVSQGGGSARDSRWVRRACSRTPSKSRAGFAHRSPRSPDLRVRQGGSRAGLPPDCGHRRRSRSRACRRPARRADPDDIVDEEFVFLRFPPRDDRARRFLGLTARRPGRVRDPVNPEGGCDGQGAEGPRVDVKISARGVRAPHSRSVSLILNSRNGRRSPRRRGRTSPGAALRRLPQESAEEEGRFRSFANPDFELPVEWLEDAARADPAGPSATRKDTSRPGRVLVVCGAARHDQTCPGEMSKTFRPWASQGARKRSKAPGNCTATFLDLSPPHRGSTAARSFRARRACRRRCRCVTGPCSCYPQLRDGPGAGLDEREIYPRWVAADGVMNPHAGPTGIRRRAVLKLMIDRLVCADGGNPRSDDGRTAKKAGREAKALELQGWSYPRPSGGDARLRGLRPTATRSAPKPLRRSLHDWLTDMAAASGRVGKAANDSLHRLLRGRYADQPRTRSNKDTAVSAGSFAPPPPPLVAARPRWRVPAKLPDSRARRRRAGNDASLDGRGGRRP